MTGYKPGDVVLLPFPFTDLTTTKQRPAVVISSERFNDTHPDLIVLALTSQIPAVLQPDEFLLPAEAQQSARLPKPSLVKLSKILTIDQRLIRKTLGQLSQPIMRELIRRFQELLARF